MKRIHILNYESYALDYLEGQLTPEDQQAFEAFLQQHPEVAADLEGLDEFQLVPPVLAYPHKRNLYRRQRLGWAWGVAAGWALIISFSALCWLLPTPKTGSPAVALTADVQSASVAIERVSASSALIEKERPAYEKDVLEPAYRPSPELQKVSYAPTEISIESSARPEHETRTSAKTLPFLEMALLQPEVTIIHSQRAQWAGLQSTSARPKTPGLLNPDKIALFDPVKQILPDDQKEWVSNWRPLESIKEEINRDRWAEALTPEFLYSPKSAK